MRRLDFRPTRLRLRASILIGAVLCAPAAGSNASAAAENAKQCRAAYDAADYIALSVYCSQAARERARAAAVERSPTRRDAELALEAQALYRAAFGAALSRLDRAKALEQDRAALEIMRGVVARHPSDPGRYLLEMIRQAVSDLVREPRGIRSDS